MGASVSEEKEVISSEAKETEVKEALQNAAKLLASLVEKQKAWEDPSFPPGQGALCHDWQALPKAKCGRFATLVWCRCEEAMGAKQVPIFPSTGPVPTDVRQGMLGDCYFLAALSSIAEAQPELLQQVVYSSRDGLSAGVCICRLSRSGQWVQVPVSHSLPCRREALQLAPEMRQKQAQEGQVFAFSSSCSQSLWVPLLEKAWARLNGSYQAAERGAAAEALAALTGAPAQQYSLRYHASPSEEGWWPFSSIMASYPSHSWAAWAGRGMSDFFWGRGPERDTKEKVWQALEGATKKRQPMCASCQGKKKPPPVEEGFFARLFSQAPPAVEVKEESDYEEDQVDEVTGLVGAHCYTVLSAVEAAANGGKSWFRTERWLRLRNPWGTGRWKGPGRKPGILPFVDCGLGKDARRRPEAKPDEQEGPEGPLQEVDAGTFWIRFADFCEEFSTVGVSKYRPGHVSSLCRLAPQAGKASQANCTLELVAEGQKPCEVVVSVIQESDEPFNRNKRRKYSAARIELLEFTSPGSPGGAATQCTQGARHVASSSFAIQREVVLEANLKPGVTYLAVVHWLQATPPQSWNSDCTLRVYAPCRAKLCPNVSSNQARREAYEAAAMGPRGKCLKEEQGAQLRCWSDREAGTVVLLLDATSAPAGLLASVSWTLQNALLQPHFPDWAGSVQAAGVAEKHVQVVELQPGQRQLTVVSWLDPNKAFSASYSWQAAAEPCAECSAPVGTAVPGRFSGAYHKLGTGAVHEECYASYMQRTAQRCIHCAKPVAQINGFGGKFFQFEAQKLGDHPGGAVHAECCEAFQRKFAQRCLQCGQHVMRIEGKHSGQHFNYKDGHYGRHGEGPVHEECHGAFLRKWAPSCAHCKEPLVKMGGFSGQIFEIGPSAKKVHEECLAEFQGK